MKISVLTPSIRPAGLAVTQKSLEYQTFTDFEWIQEIGLPKRGHNLNYSYNRMLERAQGELIVSLQDYIFVPPDYLQRFWDAYQKYPKAFITAPVGKVDNIEYKPPAKWDWRAFANELDPAATDIIKGKWDCWEIDSACAPKSALFEIGGFDEELDKDWSCDNLNVGCRARLAGYEFYNLFSNPAIAYDHDAFIDHPFRKNFRPIFNKQRMDEFEAGLKINFLRQ